MTAWAIEPSPQPTSSTLRAAIELVGKMLGKHAHAPLEHGNVMDAVEDLLLDVHRRLPLGSQSSRHRSHERD